MRRRVFITIGIAFVTGVLAAVGYVRLRTTMPSDAEVVAKAEVQLSQVPKRVAEAGLPTTACPETLRNELVPTAEFDDLQQTSSEWHFLADEHFEGLRGSRDARSAESILAAKRMVVFAGPTKQLPTNTAPGVFRGTMVLVDLETGAVLCGQPLEVEAPISTFKTTFREQALQAAQRLGVRIGLPGCKKIGT